MTSCSTVKDLTFRSFYLAYRQKTAYPSFTFHYGEIWIVICQIRKMCYYQLYIPLWWDLNCAGWPVKNKSLLLYIPLWWDLNEYGQDPENTIYQALHSIMVRFESYTGETLYFILFACSILSTSHASAIITQLYAVARGEDPIKAGQSRLSTDGGLRTFTGRQESEFRESCLSNLPWIPKTLCPTIFLDGSWILLPNHIPCGYSAEVPFLIWKAPPR